MTIEQKQAALRAYRTLQKILRILAQEQQTEDDTFWTVAWLLVTTVNATTDPNALAKILERAELLAPPTVTSTDPTKV